MNRKDFLARAIGAGAGCSAWLALGSSESAGCQNEGPIAAGTPCDKKYEFAQKWVKRFLDILDEELDETTRARLLETQGRLCYRGAHGEPGPQKPQPGDLDRYVAQMQKRLGADAIRREGNVIHFQYVRNPSGLRVADGWCLCPVVEKGPPGLSGTYCHCSVGYVTEMFQRRSHLPVKVDLVESLKRGGKTCRFRIQVGEEA